MQNTVQLLSPCQVSVCQYCSRTKRQKTSGWICSRCSVLFSLSDLFFLFFFFCSVELNVTFTVFWFCYESSTGLWPLWTSKNRKHFENWHLNPSTQRTHTTLRHRLSPRAQSRFVAFVIFEQRFSFRELPRDLTWRNESEPSRLLLPLLPDEQKHDQSESRLFPLPGLLSAHYQSTAFLFS